MWCRKVEDEDNDEGFIASEWQAWYCSLEQQFHLKYRLEPTFAQRDSEFEHPMWPLDSKSKKSERTE